MNDRMGGPIHICHQVPYFPLSNANFPLCLTFKRFQSPVLVIVLNLQI